MSLRSVLICLSGCFPSSGLCFSLASHLLNSHLCTAARRRLRSCTGVELLLRCSASPFPGMEAWGPCSPICIPWVHLGALSLACPHSRGGNRPLSLSSGDLGAVQPRVGSEEGMKG